MAESVRDESSSAVVVANRGAIVRAGGSPSDVIDAFGEYQQIQSALDRALPDCIMEIQGRKFRKKNYWRAIGTAFNLDVTCEREERTTVPDDWGYVVTYRATAPNGRSTTGDGACFASEKAVYAKDWSGGKGRVRLDADGQPVLDTVRTRENQTTHNVRGHAHTRAFNRAVSNLVGFGEVSAEEMQRERHEDEPRDVSPKRTSVARSTVAEVFNAPAAKPATATPSGDVISDPQRKRLLAITYQLGESAGLKRDQTESEVKAVMSKHGYSSTKDIRKVDYDTIIDEASAVLRGYADPTAGGGPVDSDQAAAELF